jgi:DNA polymerase-3 subunit epsilon
MFAPRLAFVDVETTGSSPARERVTEVGVVCVEADGDALRVREWSTLVNPGVPIPSEIQWLTGITNEMVRAAPPFALVAEQLFDLLADGVFVAHNARFDYGFLKAEFERAGMPWSASTLCTVRLSRLLYPDRSPHGLDAIVARFGLDGEQRHRALGDARVLWRFLQCLYQRHPVGEVDAAAQRLLAHPSTPPALPPGTLESIPAVPGIYYFYGLNAHPIYIGKAVDLHARVASHFANDHRSAGDLRLSQEVQRVEWEETAGEIGALLRESELVKSALPAHNVALRRKARPVLLRFGVDDKPQFPPPDTVALDALEAHYGPFSSRANARHWLIELASEHGLCLRLLRLEGRGGKLTGATAESPCFNFQLHRCAGACVGQESRDTHRARLAELVAARRVQAWPYPGAIAVAERDDARGREDWHVFDRWCWLGTVRTLAAAHECAAREPRRFEADVYRIVRDALARVAAGVLACEPLDQLSVTAMPGEPGAAESCVEPGLEPGLEPGSEPSPELSTELSAEPSAKLSSELSASI